MKTETPQKRDDILAAALALFTEQGFHGTSVPQIAERAGVGAGTIYRYFESKEALVNALLQYWKERLLTALTVGFPAQAPVREQFSFLWQQLAGFATEHPTAFAFLETHYHTPYLDEITRAMMAQLNQFLFDFLAESRRQGVIKELPPQALIALVFGSFVGLFKAAQASEVVWEPQLLAEAERCCWEAIRL